MLAGQRKKDRKDPQFPVKLLIFSEFIVFLTLAQLRP